MALFNFGRHHDDDYEAIDLVNGGKIYKVVNMTSMIGMFIIVAVLLASVFGYVPLTTWLVGVLGTMLIVCIGLSSSLFWVRRIEKKEHTKLAIVFTALVGVCSVLWIICLWIGVSLFNKLQGDDLEAITTEMLVADVNFIKWTFIITLQIIVASFVANGIVKYGKKLLVIQIIGYISYLYFDFYITTLMLSVGLTVDDGFVLYDSIEILANRFLIMLLIISIIYVAISQSVMKKYDRGKFRKSSAQIIQDVEAAVKKGTEQETTEQKLSKLKDLLDKQLITEEEYNKKRDEIINNM